VRKVLFCLTALLALGSVSCGNKHNLYPVLGEVRYKGSPAAGAAVFFHRQGADSMNEHLIMSIVQEDGSFELVCGTLGKGAPPGEYAVTIQWKEVAGQGNGRPQHGSDKLNSRYSDPKHPLLHATVQAGTNHLPPFEITD
jgi:hypothetical protein